MTKAVKKKTAPAVKKFPIKKKAAKAVTKKVSSTKKTLKPAGKKSEGTKLTIGAVAKATLLEGKTTDAVIAAVKKQFPDSSFSASSVAWYKTQLRKEGKGSKLHQSARGRPTEEKKVYKAPKKKSDKTPKSKPVASSETPAPSDPSDGSDIGL